MTPAEGLKRRVQTAYVLLGLFAAFVVLAGWLLPKDMQDAATAVGLVPLACAVYLMNVRCPRCRAFLGGAVAIGMFKGTARHGIDACPSCALPLDEQPGPPGAS